MMMKLIIFHNIIYIYYSLSAAVTPAAGHYSSQVQNGVYFFCLARDYFVFLESPSASSLKLKKYKNAHVKHEAEHLSLLKGGGKKLKQTGISHQDLSDVFWLNFFLFLSPLPNQSANRPVMSLQLVITSTPEPSLAAVQWAHPESSSHSSRCSARPSRRYQQGILARDDITTRFDRRSNMCPPN